MAQRYLKRTLGAISLVAAVALTGCLPAPTGPAVRWGLPLDHIPGHAPDVVLQAITPSWVPIDAALREWGLTPTHAFCTQYPAATCITADVQDLPASNELGLTIRTIRDSDQHVVSVAIHFSPKLANYSAAYQLQTACHEFGHAYGLGHDTTGGCMAAGVTGLQSAPSAQELALLHDLYQGP